jgi:biopolymer transport protein TolR
MTAAISRRRRRKLKSEINVVPYIDVMLVLLVIFMVTAPLLTLGVDVNLPQSSAKAVNTSEKPLTVEIDAQGGYALTLPEGQPEPMTLQALVAKIAVVASHNPKVTVLVGADQAVPYQTVYDTLVLIANDAKVAKVGLISRPRAAR